MGRGGRGPKYSMVGATLPRGTMKVPLNEKLWLLNLEFCVQRQAGKRGVAILAGVTDPDHQEEGSCFYTAGGQEECVWDSGDPCGHLLCSLAPLEL